MQKHKAYTYTAESGQAIEHHKHLVVIPEDVVQKLGWEQGVELTPVIRNNALVLMPKDEQESEI